MSMTNEYEHMFTFKVFVSNVSQSSCNPAPEIEDVLLVDTGAITYILDTVEQVKFACAIISRIRELVSHSRT